MKNLVAYLDFIKEKGRQLSEINPGSDELALTVEDALWVLDLLQDSGKAILGGDILSEENNKLVYAYNLWGDKYLYLNWYCDKIDSESKGDYLIRSYNEARSGIVNASKVAEELKKSCYIVFVVEE